MPCKECGESAWEKSNGYVVGLEYIEGTAVYTCLDCAIEQLEEGFL